MAESFTEQSTVELICDMYIDVSCVIWCYRAVWHSWFVRANSLLGTVSLELSPSNSLIGKSLLGKSLLGIVSFE